MLKTALLVNSRGKSRGRLLDNFRGHRAHDIDWLAGEFRSAIQAPIPRNIIRHLSRVAPWSTDLRYEPGLVRPNDAGDFFESVRVLTDWLDKRI